MNKLSPMIDQRDGKAVVKINICPFAKRRTISLEITRGEQTMNICLSYKKLKKRLSKLRLSKPVYLESVSSRNHCIQAYSADRPFEKLVDIKLYHGKMMISAVISQDEWKQNIWAIKQYHRETYQQEFSQLAVA